MASFRTDYKVDVIVDPTGAVSGSKKVEQSLKRVDSAASNLSNTLRNVFVGFSAFQAINQLITLSDKFVNLNNRLKVSGISANQLTASYNKLSEISNQTFQSIEAMAGVFQRASMSANELGASNSDLFGFITNIGNALRIQGGSSQAAAGALFQLGQALGGANIQAQEFNSIIDGAFPIAQAAARGIDEAGGSVTRLRKLVIDGKVTSKAFFDAILSQSQSLKDQLAGVTITVAQAFVVLNNNIITYVGRLNEATGATGFLVDAVLFMSKNLETIGNVLQASVITALTFLAAKAIPAVISGLSTLAVAIATNPFTALAGAIVASIAALVAFRDQMKSWGSDWLELSHTTTAFFEFMGQGLQAIGNYIAALFPGMEQFASGFDVIARTATYSLELVVQALDFTAAAFSGSYAAVVGAWNNLPGAFTEIAQAALNGAIAITEKGVNILIGLINSIPFVKDATGGLGPANFGRVDLGGANPISSGFASAFDEQRGKLIEQFEQIRKNVKATSDLGAATEALAEVTRKSTRVDDEKTGALKKKKKAAKEAKDSFEALNSVVASLSDALATFVTSGKLDFKSLADSILTDLTRIAASSALKQLFGMQSGPSGLDFIFGGGGQTMAPGVFGPPKPGAAGIFGDLFGGGGGGIGGALGSLLGFNNGGSMQIGGIGGVDNNVLSLNNRPVAKVSRGEMLNIKRNRSDGGGEQKPVMITMNIQTPDANSFGRAQDQILSQMASRLARAQRRNS